ncbi:hypothetical protein [Ideonella sp.]|uniref:hypothetical protein n=1 Tax=Ideonella sp. TaxID=1929293 RepID=UPI0035AF4B5D
MEYWEPILDVQVRDLVEDGFDLAEVNEIIAPTVKKFRECTTPPTGRPTEEDIEKIYKNAGGV